jgi:dTDP-4-amino-4,6-dideoxygalactose transaminase
MQIDYARQSITEDDIKAVKDVLRSNRLTQGPKIAEFEKALCEYTGAKYCVVVNSGTSALELAIKAMNSDASHIVTTPLSFMATSNAILRNDKQVIWSDIDKNGQMKLDYGYDLFYPFIPVHFAGNVIEVSKLKSKEVIEDACHALGGSYENGKKVGCCEHSLMTCFSFHPAKNITCGEGGAITTNSEDLYEDLKILRDHGRKHGDMIELSSNYRMTDIQAALGISQLKKLDLFISARKGIVKRYRNELRNDVEKPKYTAGSAYNLYIIKIDSEHRDSVRNQLAELGIQTQIHYRPIYNNTYYHNGEDRFISVPKAEQFYDTALTLPLYPSLTKQEVDYIIKCVNEVEI